ncbi:DUF7311 family protein [Halorussus halobius]|uniref:DUF7311 family protein n=1 Tax=Halorussus halobius TaxID=1710537 RepID=UPI001092210A|nr:hypothetical protein [Halorussus halobius]
MLRLVLGVALAAALLGAVAPALEDARATRTDRLAARELDRVAAAAESLAREEAPGARRTLDLSLPGDSPTTAPLAFVALGGVPSGETAPVDRRGARTDDERGVLAYRLAGGPVEVRRVGLDLRAGGDGTRGESDSRALVLRGGGTYHLTLRLVRNRGRPTVAVAVGRSVGRATTLARAKPPPTAAVR